MGCDIHAVVEARVCPFDSDYYTWKVLEDIVYINRNYSLFTFLAGVRDTGEIDPISEPKGIPLNKYGEDDISPMFKAYIKSWGVDGHSHSWLSLKEMKTARNYLSGKKLPWLETPFFRLVDRMIELKTFYKIQSDEDIRLIFFFDN